MTTTALEKEQLRTPIPWVRYGVSLLVIFIGLGLVLYPLVATQWNNAKQQRAAEMYQEYVQDVPVEDRSAMLDAAREYSYQHRNGPILDPWLARVTEDNEEYQEYLRYLRVNEMMGQVVIPSINVNLPLYHGTSEDVLQIGLGHLYGSSFPVGGDGLHSVITGHTGLTHSTMFDNLDDIELGDAIYVNVLGQTIKYEVHDTQVVLPNQTEGLAAVDGHDLLTLITCTPYGINSHRLLVHAHRVPMDPQEEVIGEAGSGMQWWMWVSLGIALAVIIGLIVWFVRNIRERQSSVGGADNA